MIRLTITAGIGYDRDGLRIPEEVLATSLGFIRKHLAHNFGGFTETDATGGWSDGGGSYVEEPTKVFTIFMEDDVRAEERARDAATTIGLALRQQALLVSLESVPQSFFVYPKETVQ